MDGFQPSCHAVTPGIQSSIMATRVESISSDVIKDP